MSRAATSRLRTRRLTGRAGVGAAALGLLGVVAARYAPPLRHRILTWGATDAEAAARLPSDELLETPTE